MAIFKTYDEFRFVLNFELWLQPWKYIIFLLHYYVQNSSINGIAVGNLLVQPSAADLYAAQ